MAGEVMKFLLILDDKFSGPLKQGRDELGHFTEAVREGGTGLGDFGKALGEVGGYIGPVIAASAAMAAIGGAAVLGGAALALHASEAKEETLDTLDAMLGSQEAALSTYEAIEDMGADIGLSLERGSELAKQLSAAGITNAALLKDSILAIGETEKVLGEGAGAKIQKILEKSSQTGQFKITGKQLVGTGVVQADLEAQLSKQLGVVPKVVKAQLAAGKISAKEGMEALTTILDQKFGELASKKALNLGSQFQLLKNNDQKLFEHVDAGPFLESFHNIVTVV